MPLPESSTQPYIATIEHLGRRYTVTCRVAFDGIEYVGRLWFAEEDWEDAGLPDRAAIPGRTRDEVIALARRLTSAELELRHRRALAEKRRFMRLRRVTDDILTKIRYLNQIAISMRDGLLDEDGAKQEIELTERQLHECVDRLRHSAGVEE
ncbi:MAG TPA: hypothetical protein VHB25_15585 [Gemmatimonadaceae bacterium]|nr:hypothetical protein [Gemmatimonadaceae bacterium]